jgi:hypothetical protein
LALHPSLPLPLLLLQYCHGLLTDFTILAVLGHILALARLSVAMRWYVKLPLAVVFTAGTVRGTRLTSLLLKRELETVAFRFRRNFEPILVATTLPHFWNSTTSAMPLAGGQVVEIENGVVTMKKLQIEPIILEEYLVSCPLNVTIEDIERFAASKSGASQNAVEDAELSTLPSSTGQGR